MFSVPPACLLPESYPETARPPTALMTSTQPCKPPLIGKEPVVANRHGMPVTG